MTEKTTSDRTEELIAHVAGRLPADESAQIAAAAQSDPQLSAGVATLAAIREDLRRRAEDEQDGGHEFGWARLSKAIDQEHQRSNAARMVNRWRAVAAIAVMACAVQGLLLLTASGPEQARFKTAAMEAVQPFVAQVTFSPEAREGDLRALLIAANGRIIEGPSSLGVYLVAFDDEDARKSGLAAFDAAGAIVTFSAAQ